MKKLITLLIVIMLSSAYVSAAPPTAEFEIKYKHKLAYPKTYKFRMSLWTGDETDPAAVEVWSEGDIAGDITMKVTGSKIKYVLGSLVPLNPADFVDQLWLQIERWKGKTGEWIVIGPRMKLGIVPYALHSFVSDASSTGGSVTSVTAGTGLTQDVTTGDITISADIGTGADQVAAGIHTHDGADITSAVANAVDADTVDGKHASAFAPAGHNHDTSYVGKTGDTMSGDLVLDTGAGNNLVLSEDGIARTGDITVDATDAAVNTTVTIRNPDPVFAADLAVEGTVTASSFSGNGSGLTGIADSDTLSDLSCAAGEVTKWNGASWICAADNGTSYTAGNQLTLTGTTFDVQEGSGSGLDADLLDGMEAADFAAAAHNHDATYVNEGQADSVTGAMIVDGSVTDADITGPISDAKLSANVMALNTAQTVTGVKTFNPSSGSVPFAIDATKTAMVANLNAEMIGGLTIADLDNRYSQSSPFQIPVSNSTSTLDSTGDVGRYTSITIGADGLPIIKYYDVTNGDLKVIKCGDIACSGGNTITTVDATGDVGTSLPNSIALGTDGLPFGSYQDTGGTALKFIKCGDNACSSGNTISTVDAAGADGGSTILGLDGLPIIAYSGAGGTVLRVAKCGDVSCSAGNTITDVDIAGTVGTWASILIGTDGLPFIAYEDWGARSLLAVKCGDAACSSGNTLVNVDAPGKVGTDISTTMGADGLPIIAYHNASSGTLKVTKCTDASCNGTTKTIVDSSPGVGLWTSITVGNDGLPLISYYDSTNGDLKVLKCGNAECSSGNTIVTVDSTGDVGKYTSITIGADGLPIISYYDVTNGDLKVTKCANTFCINNWSRR